MTFTILLTRVGLDLTSLTFSSYSRALNTNFNFLGLMDFTELVVSGTLRSAALGLYTEKGRWNMFRAIGMFSIFRSVGKVFNLCVTLFASIHFYLHIQLAHQITY